MLSLKLALRNLKSGLQAFAPFLLATTTMFVLVFVTASISFSPSIDKMKNGRAVGQLMGLALIILSIFAVIILLYSYRFLQLNRSREFGLYDILGFGKGRIIGLAFWELLLSYLVTSIAGTLVGIALGKFLFLIFVNLIGGTYFDLIISPLAIFLVAGLFAFFFLLLMLVGGWMIYRHSSLDLLREAARGEREPKGNIVLAALSLILLGAGYYIALTVTNPISALSRFFLAVILVILGTYLFYLSFTVWYLKWKKKRDSYYQHPQNFITTSSMLYRMKANAAGLGNITILLSMSLVTIIVTLGIFFGTAKMVTQQFPREGQAVYFGPNTSRDGLRDYLQTAAGSAQVAVKHITTVQSVSDLLVTRDGQTKKGELKLNFYQTSRGISDTMGLTVVSREDLQALGNDLPSIGEGQALVYDLNGNTKHDHVLSLAGQSYQILRHLDQIKNFPIGQSFLDAILVVLPDTAALDRLAQDYVSANSSADRQADFPVQTYTFFDVSPKEKKEEALRKAFEAGGNKEMQIMFKAQVLASQKTVIGGFVFIGFVLGLSFILGAALIIYYKQLSEGNQDKRSYKILQEVGLSKDQVVATIKSQVRMIFFLPLLVTILHLAGAYVMIYNIIKAFEVNDIWLILMITGAAIFAIAILYWIIYKLTSRVYYKIVERQESV